MRKVVFVHLLNDFSGSPRVLKDVIESVESVEKEALLCVGSSGPGILSSLNLPKKLFWYKRSSVRLLTFFSYFVSQLLLFVRLLFAKEIAKDAIIYINTLLPFAAALYGKLTGRKVVYHLHEISLSPLLLKNFLLFVCRKTSTLNIYVSDSHMQQLPIEGVRRVRIYNTIDQQILADSSGFQYSKKCNNKFTVLLIGSLREYKGVFEFVRLATEMVMYKDVQFIFLANASSAEIEKFFTGTLMPENLVVHPKTDDVTPFYREASVVVNLSRVDMWQETFGLTIIEAMAYGIPVIVPPAGAPVELVQDGVEGYRIDSRDSVALKTKIIALYEDDLLCDSLSLNALEASRRFSRDTFTNEIVRILRKDVGGKE